MSGFVAVRRADKLMENGAARAMLERGYCGRLATVGADGYTYCAPLLYVVMDGAIHVHNARARGHLRANVEHEARACFELDEPDEVFPYGRFECDTSIAYRSVIAFGRIRIVEDREVLQRFFSALMTKYGKPDWGRPQDFFPRLDQITVYALTIERLTGKETPLPPIAQQWPAVDRTKTPNARP